MDQADHPQSVTVPPLEAALDAVVAKHLEVALRQFQNDFRRIRSTLVDSVRSLADKLERLEPMPMESSLLQGLHAASLSAAEPAGCPVASLSDLITLPETVFAATLPFSVQPFHLVDDPATGEAQSAPSSQETSAPADGEQEIDSASATAASEAHGEVAIEPLESEVAAPAVADSEDSKAVGVAPTRVASAADNALIETTAADDDEVLGLRNRQRTQAAIDLSEAASSQPAPAQQERGHHEPATPLAGQLFSKAEQHRQRGEHAPALARYREVLKLDPQFVPAYRERGQLLRSLGRREQARHDLERACELDPDDAESFLRRGNIRADLGRLDEAIADYSHAIELDPARAVFYYNRGLAHAKKHAFTEVIADSDQALALDPNLVDAYFIRGFALHSRKRYDEALADFTRLLEINPDNLLAWNERSLVYVSKRKYVDAIRDCGQALKLNPRHLLVRYNRGIAYRLNGDHDMAIADFTEVLRRRPKNHQVNLNRGMCYFAQGDFERAVSDLARAHELAPDNQEIAQRLADAESALRKPVAATPEKAEQAADKNKDEPAHIMTVACPECETSCRIPWGRLDEAFACKICKNIYRVNRGGRLVWSGGPNPPTEGWKKLASHLRVFSARRAVAAVVLVALLTPLSVYAIHKDAVKKWHGFNVQELCTMTDKEPTKVESLRGLDAEVSGLVQSVDGEQGLLLASKDARIVCKLDSYALSTKRLISTVQPGSYVIVKGVFTGARNGEVSLSGGRLSLVDRTPMRGLALGSVFVKK